MSITFTSPSAGAIVKGIVKVLVTAPGTKRINFQIDGVHPADGTDLSAPFEYNWDTTKYPDGPHTVKAIAGNGKTSSSVNVVVANGVIPPPPDRWPSSAKNGPLGASNILPARPGAFVGSMFGGIGYGWAEATGPGGLIDRREAAMARRYDFYQFHMGGGLDQPWPADQYGPAVVGVASPTIYYNPTQAQFCAARGVEYTFAWTPGYTIAQMNQGAADAVWTKMAKYLSSLRLPNGSPQRVIIRAFHEFDLPSTSYGIRTTWDQAWPGSFTVTPAQFIAAWKRMVDIFHSSGATNVGFEWCPTEGAIGDRSIIPNYYPGNALVDWVSSDWYNTWPAGWVTPLHYGWGEFEELFHYDALGSSGLSKYTQIAVANGKPFVIGETGCLGDPNDPARKGNWMRNICGAASRMPMLAGISYFDCDVTGLHNNTPNPDYDYRVDQNAYVVTQYGQFDPVSLAGWVAMSNDPAFGGTIPVSTVAPAAKLLTADAEIAETLRKVAASHRHSRTHAL